MKERPILFSAPMVRAILEGRKTQTRRVVRKQFAPDADPAEVSATSPEGWQISGHSGLWWDDAGACIDNAIRCPYGKPCDRLWVRETWGLNSYGDETNWLSASGTAITKETLVLWDIAYRADFGPMQDDCYWRPSIHMPRWASRITLEITGVRVERLNSISEADAIEEGTTPSIVGDDLDYLKYRAGYQTLWESINGPGSWEENPWVWVIEFKRIGE